MHKFNQIKTRVDDRMIIDVHTSLLLLSISSQFVFKMNGFVLVAIFALCSASLISESKGIAVENVTFWLYTREDPSGSRIITYDSSTVENTPFNPNLPTKILVHGWMNDLNSECIQLLKREFLALEPMNVIGVGWPSCSHIVLYEQAVECSKEVGTYIGELINWLVQTTGLSPSNVHALGHSAGGQAVSFISRVLQISRISAFDPAGPLYQHVEPSLRIDSSDAVFVEAFHTSTAILGMKTQVAHVDFFPNGGVHQPGCNDIFGSCAHGTSFKYYANTIPVANRQEYLAFKCEFVEDAKNETCTGEPREIMGYGASTETRGIYYLNISNVPYAKKEEHVLEH